MIGSALMVYFTKGLGGSINGGTPLSLDGLEFISMENTNLKWMTGGTSSHQETSI